MKDINKKAADAAARRAESGNVLFLILIAVALFAALSYAVTQSSRSGGGDANSEKSLVSSGELTQYPAGVRTSIVRMLISNSLTVDELEFNTPSDFGASLPIDDSTTENLTNAAVKQAVFHPSGGGATYQQAGQEVMANQAPGTWYFNQLYNVPGIGSSKNDLIAWLVGINASVCQKIDDQLGISTMPVVSLVSATIQVSQVATNASQTSPVITPTVPVTQAAFPTPTTGSVTGQPFACVSNGASPPVYIYYHVLVEQ